MFAAIGIALVYGGLRNQFGHKGQVQGHAEHDFFVRIHGNAAPVEYTKIARIHNGALQRRRGVAAFIAQFFEFDAAQHLVNQAGAPHVFFGERCGVEAEPGYRLHWRSMVFGNGLGAHVHLADGHNRLAAGAVEHIHIALFGGHGQPRLHALGGGDVEQRGLRRGIHIP